MDSTVEKKRKEANPSDGYPLTPLQHGLLMESMVGNRPGINIEQVVAECNEVFHAEHFHTAWQKAVDAFDALRLEFSFPTDGPPVQSVSPHARVSFLVHQRPCDTTDTREALEAFLETDRRTPFDPSVAPLCRVNVIQFDDDRWAAVFTAHHAVVDGNAFAPIMRRVFETYDALLKNVSPPSDEAPSYRSFLRWRADWDHADGAAYFERLLSGFTEAVPLPAPNTASAAGVSKEITATLSESDTARISEAAAAAGVTPNSLVQFAWGVLLSR